MKSTDVVDILIVDDREDGLIALEAVLQPLPAINLVRARSGVEALNLLPKYDFGVILLDVQMPILDGFQTAKIIREKHERYKYTPIIFVTAINKDDQYIYKGYEAGAVDYVFKPFEPHILRSKVSVFLDLHRKSAQLEAQSEKIQENERRERYLKMAELELDNLKRYRNLADAIPHIVWKAKINGTLEYFNKVWIDYTGLSLEKSIGSGWQEAVYKDDLNKFLKIWIQAMSSGQSFEVEVRIRDAEGNMKWHLIRSVPEVINGEVASWLGTCTNIHEQKINAERLDMAQKEAIKANLAKTHFLANMSHEIRTPMSAILGFTELMQHPNQSEEQRAHCISTIHRNGKQLLSIIDEILDISKVETGNLSIENIEFNIISMLNEIKSLLFIQTESKGLEFTFTFKSKIPEIVSTDPTRLRQIIMNVVGNAIKFTEKGKIEVEIDWLASEADSKKGHIKIYVIDTGVGIEENHVSRLFQPFAQVDSSTTRRFGGTGLGLALSRKLAQALSGDVKLIKTKSGSGSTFEIAVEVKIPQKVNWTNTLSQSTESDKLKKAFQNEKEVLRDVNILLVDDAPDNQTVIGLFLGLAGAHVEYADNGEEGVEKALTGNYNVVLMDIQMPRVDGYEATRRLRAQGYKTPIIALTAHALKEERDRCLSIGCTDHFTKPIDRAKLISLVDQVVHRPH